MVTSSVKEGGRGGDLREEETIKKRREKRRKGVVGGGGIKKEEKEEERKKEKKFCFDRWFKASIPNLCYNACEFLELAFIVYKLLSFVHVCAKLTRRLSIV